MNRTAMTNGTQFERGGSMIGLATPAVTVSLPRDGYLQELRAIGAWWCLGSSALEPRMLAQYRADEYSLTPHGA